jgi:hypothetical protein
MRISTGFEAADGRFRSTSGRAEWRTGPGLRSATGSQSPGRRPSPDPITLPRQVAGVIDGNWLRFYTEAFRSG